MLHLIVGCELFRNRKFETFCNSDKYHINDGANFLDYF